MSKHISEFAPEEANRTVSASGLHQQPRQRLAERLVALAPLAREPLMTERERQALNSSRSTPTANESNALVPLRPSGLPRAREPVSLSPVGVSSPRLDTKDELDGETGYGLTGFLVGLAVATATGIVLYALLD